MNQTKIKNTVPKGYKQTKLGVIPEDWKDVKLGDIGEVVSGLTYSPTQINESGTLVLRSSNVQNRVLTFDNNVFVDVQEGEFNPVKENDILICIRNGSKNLIGKNAIIDKKNEGVAFGAFMSVYRSEFNDYLFHLFDTDIYNQQVYRNLGATINSINSGDFKKFKVLLPSREEQKKIAKILSTWDDAIAKQENLITQKEHLKKGLMQLLLTGKKRFAGFEEEWEEVKLGDIGEVVSGLTYSPSQISDDGTLVLRSSNVQNRVLTFDNNVFVDIQEGDFNPVQENDILICIRNGSKHLIGKNAIIDKNTEGVAFGAFMSIYRSDFNDFLFHLFDTDIYNRQVYMNLGATINSINGGNFKKFKVLLPPAEEQTKIANTLSSADKEIENLKTQLATLKLQKQGLMQELLTGKRRVKLN